jgi:hypothetical protein
MPDYDPFANDAASVAYYGGERVEVIDTCTDKTGAMLATIRRADGSVLTVFASFISVGAK